MVYVADSSNEVFLGPVPYRDLATHILKSSGPSGSNAVYAMELIACYRRLFGAIAKDDHLERLSQNICMLLHEQHWPSANLPSALTNECCCDSKGHE
jgi:cation transport regulator ChaC